jgi:uncharacterized protein YggE
METLLNNKKFIKAAIVFVVMLSLLVFVKFINEVRASDHAGRGNQPANVITVSGSGDVTAVSDIATLSINLSKEATTTKEAQKLLNDSITKTLAYLKTQKIEDKDIKSEYGGLNPKYASSTIVCMAYPCPQQEPKIVGYTATQSITVKIRDVDNASTVRTGLADIGVTDISGPNFSIDNEDAFKDQARAKAIDEAKEKAEVLARQLGVRLGKVTSFTESSGGNYPMMYAAKGMMDSTMMAAPAPVLPKGENKISSSVTITYEIK